MYKEVKHPTAAEDKMVEELGGLGDENYSKEQLHGESREETPSSKGSEFNGNPEAGRLMGRELIKGAKKDFKSIKEEELVELVDKLGTEKGEDGIEKFREDIYRHRNN